LKRLISILILIVLARPAWPAKTITVAELTDMLKSMEHEKKTDTEVATALKQLELSQQMTRSVMNELAADVPGPLTLEQVFVLEARSAFLAPPASDIPASPAPDATGQKAILDKAAAYVTKTYAQLPGLVAKKTTLRFQDNVEAVDSSAGLKGSVKDVTVGSSFVSPYQFIHYINAAAQPVVMERGAEERPTGKDTMRWGANGYIKIQEPEPSLDDVFRTAQASGSLQWLRWELVNGRAAAVFSFTVPRKESKLEVDVCCFPEVKEIGVGRFYTAATGSALAGSEATPGVAGAAGNWQTTADWNDFKAVAPYHGRFFIDPDTGTVMRMIVESELKSTDPVRQLDTRVDYGLVKVGQNTFVLPVKSVIDSVVVPGGESQAAAYSTRTTLFTSEYAEYKPEAAQ
jgi:hypothetical protein